MTDIAPRPELTVPAASVAELRAATRLWLDRGQPTVEVDHVGQTVFVGGDWASLGLDTKPGDEALEALIEASPDPEAVVIAVSRALDEQVASVLAFRSGDQATYLKVLPIPNSTHDGAFNLLLGLSGSAAIPPTAVQAPLAKFGAPVESSPIDLSLIHI